MQCRSTMALHKEMTTPHRKSEILFKEHFNPLSLDGTVALSLGLIGACGDAAARRWEVTCLLSFLFSPLVISS